MKTSTTVKKFAALSMATVVALGGLLLMGAASSSAAHAADPTDGKYRLTFAPAGPYKNGDIVTVTTEGFSPNAPVAIGQCAVGRPVTGPGDCGASKIGASRLLQANAQGVATGKLTVIVGSLQNSKAPVESCGPTKPCYFGATNITNAKETTGEMYKIKYVGAAASTTKTTTKTETTTSNAKTTTTAAPKTSALPKTGPKETAMIALIGLALFQVGLIFTVRATRAAPRRVSF